MKKLGWAQDFSTLLYESAGEPQPLWTLPLMDAEGGLARWAKVRTPTLAVSIITFHCETLELRRDYKARRPLNCQ